MPTYDYYCSENQRTVEVFHGIRDSIETWGELCELAEIPPGETPPEADVERQIGAGLAAPREAPYAPSGSMGSGPSACCGGGCGGQ